MTTDLNATPDYDALVQALVQKTKAGRLVWEETADENAFLASVKGERTFEISLKLFSRDPRLAVFEGALGDKSGPISRAVLVVRDGNGKVLLETPPSSLTSDLHGLARRIARHVDENIDSTLQLLEQL